MLRGERGDLSPSASRRAAPYIDADTFSIDLRREALEFLDASLRPRVFSNACRRLRSEMSISR